MFTSTGIVHYTNDNWVFVYVDDQLADYYYSLIPKYHKVVKSRRPAHVSVVRPEELPSNFPLRELQNWKKHEGEVVPFVYHPEILVEKGFWWFNLWCKTMEDIRLELGLSIKSRITIPPHGYSKCFHCTVATDKL